ncbi:hypothetical protein CRENBAI_022445 [Crenichthys baileyi]|uniref:Uncharacterized protein n=1 Tax=Crenichthys baileyi TaxID=28760 RepID=A0AAV9S5Y6_9TELE
METLEAEVSHPGLQQTETATHAAQEEALLPKRGEEPRKRIHENLTELTKAIKEGILKYLNEKYDDHTTNNLLDMATFVDPRFKTAYMNEERVEFVKMKAAAELVEMVVPTPESAETAAASISSPAAEDDPAPPCPIKKTKKSLGSYFKKALAAGQDTNHSRPSRASTELELSITPSVPFGSGGSDPRDCSGCRCPSSCLRRLSVLRLGVSVLPAYRTDGLPPFNAGVAGHGGRGRCWVETETRPINGCTAVGLSGEPST